MLAEKILTEKEQEDHLNNNWKVNPKVTFTFPEGLRIRTGHLLERIVVKDSIEPSVNYWNILDFIKFQHDPDNLWLRITYYRYLKDEIVRTKKGKITNKRWIFAGQTSISDPISAFERLFVKAIKEDKSGKWIRPLFKNIMKECHKELE
ncbi:MAG: hypothetical protein ABSB89_11010 [Candidatus Bathyarchaeia archaeon]|jgi:hypothetical protein